MSEKNANKTVDVIATKITPVSIYFECPECWSKYKRNGEPTARAKRIIHNHGNETHSDKNRETDRVPHCIKNNGICRFNIKITDDTVREGFN
jgi:hypothetical protein|tara:strand:+ start:2670 stop:2945 length:276 start_codon:yes stop_codon:yes gene_type:complete